MSDTLAALPLILCAGCGSEVGQGLLSCPGCGRLSHADELRRIAADAEAATGAGDPARALALWQAAMTLLPDGAGQRAVISERIAALGPLAGHQRPPAQGQGGENARRGGIVGVVMAALLKGKALLFFMLTKAKLLLFGLTKLSTFASMGVYLLYAWQLYGWALAVGVVASIYIHEMGHVSALAFYGMPVSAPAFVPGLGAYIRLQQSPPTVRVDARIGLAGPIWGLGAALAAYGLFLLTGAPVWSAVARIGGWINLFNLSPIWQLDGGRAFRAFTQRHRVMAVVVVLLALIASHSGVLFLVLAACIWQCFKPGAEEPDNGSFLTYAGLVAAFAAIEMLPGAGF